MGSTTFVLLFVGACTFRVLLKSDFEVVTATCESIPQAVSEKGGMTSILFVSAEDSDYVLRKVGEDGNLQGDEVAVIPRGYRFICLASGRSDEAILQDEATLTFTLATLDTVARALTLGNPIPNIRSCKWYAISADSKNRVVLGDDKTISVVGEYPGGKARRLPLRSDVALAVDESQIVIVSAASSTISFLGASATSVEKEFFIPPGLYRHTGSQVSPSGEWILLSDNGWNVTNTLVRKVRLSDGKEVQHYSFPEGEVGAIGITDDGSKIAIGGSKSA